MLNNEHLLLHHVLTIFTSKGQVDECDSASAIYQCGRDKEPTVTNELLTKASGNSTVVNEL
jgi:hypothetical protein